jgi:hypothetical protein
MGFGSSSASGASDKSVALQREMYEKAIELLQPYIDLGTRGIGAYEQGVKELSKPIELNQQWLEQTPGYQFALSEGLKNTQDAAAAKGLGVSGAALKGAGEYATGLADQTWKSQFAAEMEQRQQRYNMLLGPVSAGASAAGGGANAGLQTGTNITNTWMQEAAAKDAAKQNAFNFGLQGAGLFFGMI